MLRIFSADSLGSRPMNGAHQQRKKILPSSVRRRQTIQPLKPSSEEDISLGSLLGHSPAIQHIMTLIKKAAYTEATVIIEGESGTGKDLTARVIHQLSSRHKGPFVVVDCNSLPPGLVESELFGHGPGSFTGEGWEREGALELAHNGTIFIDEVGEIPLEIQPKLLQVLERKECKRLGEDRVRSINARVIAATHRNLEHDINEQRFRLDLFYRLSLIHIRLPPLRERREDIGLLARHFVKRINPELDPDTVLSPDVLMMLTSHSWPGNVRELRNIVERLLLFPEDPSKAILQKTEVGWRLDDFLHLPYREGRKK
jgi:DNA-binding NtrC family response regulator